jgi:SAM-dependent methyltransferase
MRTLFDKFAANYDAIHKENMKGITDDISIFARYKAEHLLSLGMTPRRILDFGCGSGTLEPFLMQSFPGAELYGCDVSLDSISVAQEKFPEANFFPISAPNELAHYRGVFDLIIASCVLHHIAPRERLSWIESLGNSLAPGGKSAIFEHNPYNPVTRHLVNTCEFDVDAVLLRLKECKELIREAGLITVSSQYTLFFPWRSVFFVFAESLLRWLPLGGQYCLIFSNP